MKSKPKKPPNSLSQEFARTRAKITSLGNVRLGVTRFKMQASPSEIRRIVPLLMGHKAYRLILSPHPMPERFEQLDAPGLPRFATTDRELNWIAQTLIPYAAEISRFLTLKQAAEIAFLNGHYEQVSEKLASVETEFGVSLWLAEAQINLLQLNEGYEVQKQYSNSLMSDERIPVFIRYIISWISFRSEQNVSAKEFYRLLDELVAPEDGFSTLIHIILGACPVITLQSAGAVFGHTDLLLVIDKYLIYRTICQSLLASSEGDSETKTILAEALAPLAYAVDDPSLRRLLIACGHPIAVPPRRNELMTGIDAYTSGAYAVASDTLARLVGGPHTVDALFLLARLSQQVSTDTIISVELKADSLAQAIFSDLSHLVRFNDEASDALLRLSKIVVTHRTSSWSSSLDLIVQRQTSDERINEAKRAQAFSALRVDEENPILAFSLDRSGGGQPYLESICLSDGPNPTVSAAAGILGLNWESASEVLPAGRRERLISLEALRNGRPSEAIGVLRELYERPANPLSRSEAGIFLVHALTRAGDPHAAAEVSAELLMISRYFAQLLPLQALVEDLLTQGEAMEVLDVQHLGRLPVVICFDALSRLASHSAEPERADAFNDFLKASGVRFASEIPGARDDLPSDQLVYFLRYVCIPQVLDQSLELASTRAVEDERAKILVACGELISTAGDSAPTELMEELREIRTRQVVRDTTLRLDQSKIFVNVDGIRRMIEGSMRENWNRYRLISRQSASSPHEEIHRALQEAVGEKITIVSLSLPLTEKNKLFAKMVVEIRDLFASSKEFGLDANLSTNIRHGYVLRELRGPFVTRQLVTNRATESGEYQENVYWRDRLTMADFTWGATAAALNRFSDRVDQEIEHLNRRLLRIRSEQAPSGVFVFTLPDGVLQILQKRCEALETYEEFLDAVFEHLWHLTEASLGLVRRVLPQLTLPALQTAIADLQNDLDQLGHREELSDLISAANLVRPELQSAVERVASWFTLSGSNDYADYALQTAFEAGLATVESYFADIEFSSDVCGAKEIVMAGWTLPHFVRLFSILLENAAVHSGISSGVLAIQVTAMVDGGSLSVRVENSLAADKNLEELQHRIARINAEFGHAAALESIRTEGGSGYPKIWKLLRIDLRSEHALEVRLSAVNDFVVEIMLDSRGLVA